MFPAPHPLSLSLASIKLRLFRTIDPASLTVFRIGFGIIMLWDIWRYYQNGWISQYYLEPEFLFKYYGFEWLQPWPGDGMAIHFIIMAILAVFVMTGFLYRISTILFTLAFSFVFLLDQTRYLNHFYMVILFSTLLCVIPAHRHFSVDAYLRTLLRPSLRVKPTPAWSVWILCLQTEIILIFAGIVKINPDWLRLQPLSMWLQSRSDFPALGYFFMQDWSVAIAAYGVILLHLIGAPLLLYKRTRLTVFCLYAAFHTLNHFVFSIGIFPWFTLFASLLFFDHDWPVKFIQKIRSALSRSQQFVSNPGTHGNVEPNTATPDHQQQTRLQTNLVISFLFFWLLSQILIPLRHVLYPGNVSWTEEGHRFSWQMKLRSKVGKAIFTVRDPVTSQTWTVDPYTILTRRQYRKMATRPDMILQFAHYLSARWKTLYQIDNSEVRAQVYASLNGRNPALLIDPDRDLAKVTRDLSHADWILPLKEPFRWIDKNS